MKIISFLPIGPILLLWISGSVSLYGMEVDSTGWSLVLEPGYEESYTVIGQAKAKRTLLLQEWEQRLKVETDARNLLLKFIDLQTELEQIAWNEEISLLKVRYQKGIDLIKLLYEKILSLDHHFAGMRTYQNVLLLSNPLSYPDFQQAKSLIEEKLDKKHPFSLPAIFNTNPFMTATFSVVATLIG
ncbi:MAG: hypothetical protein KDC44_24555, partial [Phaeodactylibacter sp.]|nr:hypothetical protein [Phaeodactylibacter sp.]